MNKLTDHIRPITDSCTCSCQYPDMARLPDGTLYACWQRYENKHDQIIAAKIPVEGPVTDGMVISGDGQAYSPKIYCFKGKMYVFWSECTGGRWKLLARTVSDDGVGGRVLINESSGAFYPSITDDGQRMAVAWAAQEHGNSIIMLAYFNGAAATGETRLSESDTAYRPAIRYGGDGNLYAAYDLFDGKQYKLCAKVYADGKWSTETVVSETADWAAGVDMIPTDDGTAVVWGDIAPRADTHYWSAKLKTKGGEALVEDRLMIAKLRVWYSGNSIARDEKGTQVLAYSWDQRKMFMRCRKKDGGWSAPVSFTDAAENADCVFRPKILLDEEGVVSILFQHSPANGHKLVRQSDLYFMQFPLEEMLKLDDSVLEQSIKQFTCPIMAEKKLTRVPEKEKRDWLDRNGYIGLDLKFGDIHGQSGMSDGLGHIDQYYHYAKAVSKLDFTALTDHDAFPDVITEAEWEYMRTAANEYNRDGELTTLLAYEWTPNEYQYDYGHKNVYYRTGDGELFRSTDPEGLTPDRLFKSLKKYGAIAIPHHPSATWGMVSAATDWDFHDEEVQRAVEIYSRHAPFEKDGTESVYTKNNERLKGKYVQDALARGYRLGFTAGSDSHQLEHGTEGGILGAFVPTLTRENLFDAIYDRLTYATTGAGILLSLKVGGARMGSEICVVRGEMLKIEVDVLGTGEIESVELVKNNEDIYCATPETNACAFMVEDKDLAKGSAYYYVRVTQKDRHQAWSSPIYVDII